MFSWFIILISLFSAILFLCISVPHCIYRFITILLAKINRNSLLYIFIFYNCFHVVNRTYVVEVVFFYVKILYKKRINSIEFKIISELSKHITKAWYFKYRFYIFIQTHIFCSQLWNLLQYYIPKLSNNWIYCLSPGKLIK